MHHETGEYFHIQQACKASQAHPLPHIPTARLQCRTLCLEDAVAEPVHTGVSRLAAGRQRCMGPERSAHLVSNVQSFAAGIAHRIVIPWGEAELLGISLHVYAPSHSEITVPKYGFAIIFDQGARVTCPGAIRIMYSRPYFANPPRPLKNIRSQPNDSVVS